MGTTKREEQGETEGWAGESHVATVDIACCRRSCRSGNENGKEMAVIVSEVKNIAL